MKYYIRFGDIPPDYHSKVHRGDGVYGVEAGVSVWDSVVVNGVYFPVLPSKTTEDGMADYFYGLLGSKPVYLVAGTELEEKGSVGEPLLGDDIAIIHEYTEDYDYLKAIL